MKKPSIKEARARRSEELVDPIRFLLDAYELGETSQIPHYERAVMRAAIEMVCGTEVWNWIDEQTRLNVAAHANAGASAIGSVS